MKRLNKKGFSIVEVIIAMTVIAIVSASALTIVLKSLDNTRAAMYKADAQYLVYDALECYKVADSPEAFAAAFEFRGNVMKLDNLPDGFAELIATIIASSSPAVEGSGNNGDSTKACFYYVIADSQYIVYIELEYGNKDKVFYPVDTFKIYVIDSEYNVLSSITNYYKISKGESE